MIFCKVCDQLVLSVLLWADHQSFLSCILVIIIIPITSVHQSSFFLFVLWYLSFFEFTPSFIYEDERFQDSKMPLYQTDCCFYLLSSICLTIKLKPDSPSPLPVSSSSSSLIWRSSNRFHLPKFGAVATGSSHPLPLTNLAPPLLYSSQVLFFVQ